MCDYIMCLFHILLLSGKALTRYWKLYFRLFVRNNEEQKLVAAIYHLYLLVIWLLMQMCCRVMQIRVKYVWSIHRVCLFSITLLHYSGGRTGFFTESYKKKPFATKSFFFKTSVPVWSINNISFCCNICFSAWMKRRTTSHHTDYTRNPWRCCSMWFSCDNLKLPFCTFYGQKETLTLLLNVIQKPLIWVQHSWNVDVRNDQVKSEMLLWNHTNLHLLMMFLFLLLYECIYFT